MPDESAPANPYRLLVSTRNAHKIAEIRMILGPRFEVHDLSELSIPEVEETGATFEDNAELKALAASKLFGGWVIADDSGLEVDALGGEPGVRSARYAGLPPNDAANNNLLLKNLGDVRGKARSARFQCVIVLARNAKKLAVFRGAVEGIIAPVPRGAGGFGYDPLFIPAGYCETFAQLGGEIKNSLSHRARSLALFKENFFP